MIKNQSGFTVVETLLIVLILAVVGFGGYYVWHTQHKTKPVAPVSTVQASSTTTTKKTTTASNSYAILVPATVLSKTAECSQTITTGNDGTVAPLTCSNNDLNILAWNALVKNAPNPPKVMTLGYTATASQVESAVCTPDDAAGGIPVVDENYQLSVIYYGWSWSASDSTAIQNAINNGC